MMVLTFEMSHLSITSFPTIELPDFTLITGPNGAGKTHLLQAIRDGRVRSNVAKSQVQQPQSEIRFFDWSNLVPVDTGYFTSEQIRNEKTGVFHTFNNFLQNYNILEQVREFARQQSLPEKFVADPRALALVNEHSLAVEIEDKQRAKELFPALLTTVQAAGQNLIDHVGDINQKNMIIFAADHAKRPIISLTEKDIISPNVPSWGQGDVFQQQFARLFVSYRDLFISNQLAQFRASKGNIDVRPISDEEFEKVHGPPPWDFVNQTLKEANIGFYINSPSLEDFTQYQPQITKISSGVIVPFSSLSSGEKILMSFAFCVYYASDRRQLSSYPKLLLLDEIDAPLHPSMSKNLINTILKTIVGSFNIKVIASTHSPSTVALTPEESIYVMRPGQSGLHKTSKSEALTILTEGIPTLAISHDGRRQVFTESLADAEVYDGLYRIYKNRLNSERSLEFIGTGKKSLDGSESNSGCDIVLNLVSRLDQAGNLSVYGLLDWDGRRQSTNRIAVLAEGRRNGLENVLFDPLLIGLVLCRDCPAHKADIGIASDLGFLEFSNLPSNELQKVIDNICFKVFSSSAKEFKTAKYLGGLELQVDKRWFEMDDHKLEGLIVNAFVNLQSVTKRQAGMLMKHMIERVLVDIKDFLPIEIFEVMDDLLKRN